MSTCYIFALPPRGTEVEENVFKSKQSKVWQQAINRVHVRSLYYFIVLENYGSGSGLSEF